MSSLFSAAWMLAGVHAIPLSCISVLSRSTNEAEVSSAIEAAPIATGKEASAPATAPAGATGAVLNAPMPAPAAIVPANAAPDVVLKRPARDESVSSGSRLGFLPIAYSAASVLLSPLCSASCTDCW